MRLEAFLARIYVDERARAEFSGDPAGVSRRAGLSPVECEALIRIDRDGLEFAAQSFAAKRGPPARGWFEAFRSRFSHLLGRA